MSLGATEDLRSPSAVSASSAIPQPRGNILIAPLIPSVRGGGLAFHGSTRSFGRSYIRTRTLPARSSPASPHASLSKSLIPCLPPPVDRLLGRVCRVAHICGPIPHHHCRPLSPQAGQGAEATQAGSDSSSSSSPTSGRQASASSRFRHPSLFGRAYLLLKVSHLASPPRPCLPALPHACSVFADPVTSSRVCVCAHCRAARGGTRAAAGQAVGAPSSRQASSPQMRWKLGRSVGPRSLEAAQLVRSVDGTRG